MIKLIIGPTASGKSNLAMQIARKKNTIGKNFCVINIDSMQIYKHIPIITAQPSVEDMQEVPHFLYGFAENDYNLSFGKWIKMLQQEIQNAQGMGLEPLIVGGTMMYAYMLLNGYSQIPEIPDEMRLEMNAMYDAIGHDDFLQMVKTLDEKTPKDRQRLVYNYCLLKISGKNLEYYKSLPQIKLFEKHEVEIIIPQKTRAEVYETCNNRFIDMLTDGLLEEIDLVKHCVDLPIKRATGFVYIVNYLNGVISKEEMVEKCQQETRNYAKKQIIWLRKFANEGLIDINSIKNL